MDLEELRTVRDTERRTDSLQHLRDDFYDEATEYVRQLKRERTKQAQASGDPYTPEAMRLTDEIDAAEETIESLYERRRGKLVKLASFAAAGNAVETDGMTEQEQILFDDLVDRIEASERRVFDAMAVETGFGSSSAESTDRQTARSASDGSRSATADDRAASSGRGETEPTIGSERSDRVVANDGDDSPDPAVAATTGTDRSRPAEAAELASDEPTSGSGTDPNGVGSREPSGAGDVLAEAMGGDSVPGSRGSDSAGPGDGATVEAASAGASRGAPDMGSGDGADSPAGADSPDVASSSTGTVDSGVTRGESAASGATPTEPSGTESRPPTEAAAVAGGDAGVGGSPATRSGDRAVHESSTGQTAGETETDGVSGASDASNPSENVDREAIRVTEDVGEVYGVDERSYELAAGDTVLLPAANAKPLVERDAAERL